RDDLVTGVQTCALPIWSLSPTHGAVGLIQLNTPLTDVDRSLARLRLALVATSMTTLLVSGVLALLSGGYLAAPLETLAATCTARSEERRGGMGGRDERG